MKRFLFLIIAALFALVQAHAEVGPIVVTYEEDGVTKTMENNGNYTVTKGTVLTISSEGAGSFTMYQPSGSLSGNPATYTLDDVNVRSLFIVANEANGTPSSEYFMCDLTVQAAAVHFAEAAVVSWTQDGTEKTAINGGSYDIPEGTEVTANSKYANAILVSCTGASSMANTLTSNPYKFNVVKGVSTWTFTGQNDYGQCEAVTVTINGVSSTTEFEVSWTEDGLEKVAENGGSYTIAKGTEVTASLSGAENIKIDMDENYGWANAAASTISFTPETGTHTYAISSRVSGSDVNFSVTFTVEEEEEEAGLTVKWTQNGVVNKAENNGSYTVPLGTEVTVSFPNANMLYVNSGSTMVLQQTSVSSASFTVLEGDNSYNIMAYDATWTTTSMVVRFNAVNSEEETAAFVVTWRDGDEEKTAENNGSYTIAKNTSVTASLEGAENIKIDMDENYGWANAASSRITFTPESGSHTYTLTSRVNDKPVTFTVTFTVGEEQQDKGIVVKWTQDGTEITAENNGTYTVAPNTQVTVNLENIQGMMYLYKNDVYENYYTPPFTFVPAEGTNTYKIQGYNGSSLCEFLVTFNVEASATPEMMVYWTVGGVRYNAEAGGSYELSTDTEITATYTNADVKSMNVEIDGQFDWYATKSGNTVTFAPKAGEHSYNILALIGSNYTSDYKFTITGKAGEETPQMKVSWTVDGVKYTADADQHYTVPVGTEITAEYSGAESMGIDRDGTYFWLQSDVPSISFVVDDTAEHKYGIYANNDWGNAFVVYFTGFKKPAFTVTWVADDETVTAVNGGTYTAAAGTNITVTFPDATEIFVGLDEDDEYMDVTGSTAVVQVVEGNHRYNFQAMTTTGTLSEVFVITIDTNGSSAIDRVESGNDINCEGGVIGAPAGSRLFTTDGIELPMGINHGPGIFIVKTPAGATVKIAVR